MMVDTGWIDREEYPFESHFFDVPAGRLHYVDEGSGQPVVMVHGNPAWSFLYRDLVKRLRVGYRCIAVDHLGFGLSGKPEEWSYLPEDHGANLTALIDGLGLKNITLVVQDWGGPIGLSYAVTHPENVARIVILNTWAWPVDREPYYLAFRALVGGSIGRMLIRRYNFFARTLMPLLFADRRKLSDAVHEHYLRPLADPEDRTGCLVLPKQVTGSSSWLGRIRDGLPALAARPVLIVWGMKDIAFREKELNRWERTFPGARSIRLSFAGHFVQEEAPDELAYAIGSFLEETAPG